MLCLADVNPNIEGLIPQQGNRGQIRMRRCRMRRCWMSRQAFGHGVVLPRGMQGRPVMGGEVEPVEMPLPSTAEGFLAVPTDISGVLSISPTEGQGVCPHYVKRGLRAHVWGARLPSDLSISQRTQMEARKPRIAVPSGEEWVPPHPAAGHLHLDSGGQWLAPRRANDG